MNVKLIPGPRNEELILTLLTAKATMEEDEFPEFIVDVMQDPDTLMDYLDALYYASDNGDEMLKVQEEYFLERLLMDEKYYYAERMCGAELGY